MLRYVLRRLILLPITLFCIVIVNFVIINLAPGEPTTGAEISPEGTASRRANRSIAFGGDERYLQFREFYGLTLPIMFNAWPFISLETVRSNLETLLNEKQKLGTPAGMSITQYNDLKRQMGDQSRYVMPHLLSILNDPRSSLDLKQITVHFFIRGGSRQGYLGSNLTDQQREWNNKIEKDDQLLRSFAWSENSSVQDIQDTIKKLNEWYQTNKQFYQLDPTISEKWIILFTQTRLMRYLGRVLTLDFGTLRDDNNKTVISEVTRRFKYSLTLAILPMIISFFLCQMFGFIMALNRGRSADYSLNFIFLVLYGIPVFVAAPFLIEKVALHHNYPFTSLPFPISGFTSPDRIYSDETSWQRLGDILMHITLPVLAIMYGSLAAESRLSRTAVLEVLDQDYIRTARAKGLPPWRIWIKHVGRNAGITIVTSTASSLGVILGGALIVETLFDINGFGKFFYEAVLNRDYNVIMFSALAGSFLSLLGYLLADLAYMWLDPRITLD